jgi:DNA-directed RNA polymerase beta subunit
MKKKVEVVADTDEVGEPEEFTWDLFPVVDSKATLHLGANGLPKVGTRVYPGMILVGKIGKTRTYDPSRQPSCLELHGLSPDELRSRYGHMWKDSSLYADATMVGVVTGAAIETVQGREVAVVVIED